MASDLQRRPIMNGTHDVNKPIELVIRLPFHQETKIHLHLTILATSIMLFVSTAALDAASGGAAMGSFVYAMPDRYNPSQPMSTAIYTVPSSQDFVTRMAKLLAKRTGKLCYVGGALNMSNAAAGGTVDEEMQAFRSIVEVVNAEVGKAKAMSA
ncbi:hypothetical protein LTR78_008765 [Recurvomyces mirabilis]|uniref:Uncharacterized protein n=1 Tax=Recurvomyces mirabilis TaxID=574656 RepID=A0AAE0WHK9_9PEZI|nr:hypothetical protein LTR78_008765 [Recurvomyces mirabilis]KAK5160997.1 hypothetical protein LTS14_000791 [Recurvomyces mirabilis]